VQLFIKRYKQENDINTKYEVVAELFSSRIGKLLDVPILELKPTDEGIAMKMLKRRGDRKGIRNLEKIKRALPFEEWLLNIDLKEEHVMIDEEDNAYIIDHGHTLSAWKPLYYVVEIVNKPVTRFKLWSDADNFREGVEIVRSLDCEHTKIYLKETANEVSHLLNLKSDEITDFVDISSRILEHRKKILHLLSN